MSSSASTPTSVPTARPWLMLRLVVSSTRSPSRRQPRAMPNWWSSPTTMRCCRRGRSRGPVATAPSLIRSMRSALHVKRWLDLSWELPALGANVKPCRCSWLLAAPRSMPPPRPSSRSSAWRPLPPPRNRRRCGLTNHGSVAAVATKRFGAARSQHGAVLPANQRAPRGEDADRVHAYQRRGDRRLQSVRYDIQRPGWKTTSTFSPASTCNWPIIVQRAYDDPSPISPQPERQQPHRWRP